jgi:L-lactate dehydrogenase complex protein LldE
MAAFELLEANGCEVIVPLQTCCGQPAYNGGERDLARRLARQVINAFGDCDYVVLPSGSCAGMMQAHYPELLPDEAKLFCAKVYELTDFLVTVLNATPTVNFSGAVSYHDSCSGLRELGVKAQPRALMAKLNGLTLHEMDGAEQCCGFGGTFSVKFPEISCAIADKKCASLTATGAKTLVGGDLGCLLHLEGRMRATGDQETQVLHIAELLTGRGQED